MVSQSQFKNERGFSYITTLLALVIIVISLPILSFILNKLTSPKVYDDIQYKQFFHFIRDDALRASNVQALNDSIVFDMREGKAATLSLDKNLIKRQVQGKGYEVYVRNVKSFSAIQNDYHIKVKITSNKGDVYEKTIPLYKK